LGSVLVELGIMFFVIYVPGVNYLCGTSPELRFVYYLPFLASSGLMLIFGELRKYLVRSYGGPKNRNSCVAQWLGW
jgi:hypothetical protein